MKDSSKLVVAGAAFAGLLAVLKSKAKKVAGIGKILENDFYGATVTTKDGRHAVSFRMNGDDDIMVDALMYYPEGLRYGSEWEYWFHIGDYRTLAGAKRGAKRKMAEMGYELSDKDLNKI